MKEVQDRIQRGTVTILDGATGTELQRRGVPMHGVAWSAAAVLSHPDTVRQVHEDYIWVGADIITTNTFGTARHVLEPAGMGDRVRDVNLGAVRLAQEARSNASEQRPIVVAGSMSTMMPRTEARYTPPRREAEASYRELAGLLAEGGVELILLEMLQDMEQARLAIEAAVATGLPVWAGFSCKMAADGSTVLLLDGQPEDTLAKAIDAFAPMGLTAMGIMHTEVEHTAPALKVLAEHWSGPTTAYPHAGGWRMPNWRFENAMAPEGFVGHARQWVEMGARVVGTCCGMGPEYIGLLAKKLPRT